MIDFKVRVGTLKSLLIIFVWFTPYYLYYRIPNGSDMLTVLRLLVNCILIYNTGVVRKIQNKNIFLIIIFLLLSGYGMFFVSGSSLTFGKIIRYFEFASFVFAIFGIFQKSDRLTYSLFKAIQNLGVIYGILNLVIPGIDLSSGYGGEYFFLGAEATSVQLLAMMLVLSAYIDYSEIGRLGIKSIIIGATGFIFAVQNESGQGRVMIAVFIILILINRLFAEKFWRIIKPVFCAIFFVAINIITITLVFQSWPIAQYIIENLLGKDITLTGRDYIFTESIKIFLQHPLLGYGYESSIVNDTLSSVFVGYNSAHNAFLQMLIDCGLIATVCFIVLLFNALRGLYKNKTPNMSCIYFGLLALAMGGLVNSILLKPYYWMLLIFAVSYNLKIKDTEDFEPITINKDWSADIEVDNEEI